MAESNRIEYKQQLTDSLEKEVVAFLNYPDGGIIYIGVNDDGSPCGIPNVDKVQYYEETSRIDSSLATGVCQRICNYMNNGRTSQSALKYCLCALLFMTRIRDHDPSFLEPSGELVGIVIRTIEAMRPIKFPPAMGLNGNDGDNLSQFTLRFIKKEVTKEDFSALEGLVTSMS